MPCNEKACPFPPSEGEVLCSYHRQSYAFEISMRDEALDLRCFDSKIGTIDGLTVRYPKLTTRSFEEEKIALYHQVLASGRMVKRVLDSIGHASPETIKDWTAKEEAARELFQHARYDGGPVCCLCGCRESTVVFGDGRPYWRCRRCYFRFSVKRQTIMQNSPLFLNHWVSGIIAATQPNRFMVIKEIQRITGCTRTPAWRMNYKLRIAGRTMGLDLGYSGQKNNRLWNAVAEKAGVSLK